MKRIALAVLLFGAIAVPSGALGAAALSGSYTAHATSGPLKGTLTIKFTPGQHYTVLLNNGLVATGTNSYSGAKITFHDTPGTSRACKVAGTYSYQLSGGKLKFTRISDPNCSGRALVLAQTFTKGG